MTVSRLSGYPYLEAAQYTKAAGSNGTVTRIVVHDMEMAEAGTTAETCAQMFHTTTRQASAHFVVDNTSAIQCVPLDCKAWHAPPNAGSIGIEHAGYARQTRAEWVDVYGTAMLARSAAITARLCEMFSIPIVRLSVSDLLAGHRGLCGHVDVTNAWHQTDHTDPGPNFPWGVFLNLVQNYSAPAGTKRWTAAYTYTADSVARRFGITIDELQAANPGNNVRPGILKGVTINVPLTAANASQFLKG
jgi:N-acetyl-anhydromuramyl-L-alanine amidase AmpD